jgi:uncharacterized protein (DUF3820 family)
MTQAIGFANKFYTLWSIDKEPVYTTDSNGKHWLTGHNIRYTYHKNISFDLDKAKSLYPTLEVQEDLKGKTSSWSTPNKEDLCPNIMKFGKYYGKDINDLVEQDFQYIIWICENQGYTSNGKYATELPKVKEHFKTIEDAEYKLIESRNNAFGRLLNNGFYEFVADKNLRIYEGFAYIYVTEGDLCVTFKFQEGTFSRNEYNGFTYGLPLVNGKAKRLKGKSVRFEFTQDLSEVYQVIVKNVILLK